MGKHVNGAKQGVNPCCEKIQSPTFVSGALLHHIHANGRSAESVALANIAAHRPICVSEAACISAVFDATPAAGRQGKPIWRTSCPDAIVILSCSGVPNAGEPDFISTLEPNPP